MTIIIIDHVTLRNCYQKVVIVCRGKLPASKLKNLMHLKAFRALAEPGEAVGLLAAQVRTLNSSVHPVFMT